MKQIIVLFGLVAIFTRPAIGQTQRALIIGINTYEAPANYHTNKRNVRNVENLNGCVNDAKSMFEKLHKSFGFNAENIDTLYNTVATRNAILSSLKKMYDNSKEGDIAVLYYSGHGSHVKNSLTSKVEKQDQTIVPADTYVDTVHDIRGPELNKYFNLFVDKKVKLTVIFDCCESGSLARGPNSEKAKPRFLESENWDALDSSNYPAPEYRPGGYCLIMYASRSFETAVEDLFDSVYHGAFTYSLLKAINGQSINASANSIFQSARSILKNMPKPQEPLIAADTARLNETLFGHKLSKLNNYEGFAIEDISETNIENNEFTIRVGLANQVSKKTQLVALYDSSLNPMTLEIQMVKGLNTSIATCIYGDHKTIKPGTLFRISKLIGDEDKMMKVIIPTSKILPNKFKQYVIEAKILKASKQIKWVPSLNLNEKGPFATVFWKDQQWFLKLDTLKAIQLPDFSAQKVLDLCKKYVGFNTDSSIYVEMPIDPVIADSILNKFKKQANSYYQLVNEFGKAQYVLYANLGEDDGLVYGFRRTVISSPIDLDPLPFKTNMNPCTLQSIATEDPLFTYLIKLGKIYYWMNMAYPFDENYDSNFPYQLKMFQRDSINPILNNQITIGNKYTISLVKKAEQELIPNNYYHVTIFRISPEGEILGLNDNNTNSFPKPEKPGEFNDPNKIDIININKTDKLINGGVYTFLLVASKDPYNFKTAIEQSAVLDVNKPVSRGEGIPKQYVQKISFRAVKKNE